MKFALLKHAADMPVVVRRPGIGARLRVPPGTRKICAVLRLEEGDQGNLAHRSLKVPAALLIGSRGEDLVQFGLISEPTSQLGRVEGAGVSCCGPGSRVAVMWNHSLGVMAGLVPSSHVCPLPNLPRMRGRVGRGSERRRGG